MCTAYFRLEKLEIDTCYIDEGNALQRSLQLGLKSILSKVQCKVIQSMKILLSNFFSSWWAGRVVSSARSADKIGYQYA